MTITINGETTRLPGPTTLAGLLESLGRNPKFLAVERNETLVPRGEHADCTLADGDQLEIVTLVGGG
ncbi:MAG: sulfur carrier protein ThiS [Planctomycetota bacterium]